MIKSEIHQETFRVRHSEGDRNGVLKLRAFFDYAQEAAANHASALGVGISYLKSQQRLWVLSRVRFAFQAELPKIGEEVFATTYPTQPDRIYAQRQFIFSRDAAGSRVFAHGSSLWLLLDADTLRPLKIASALPGILPENHAKTVFFSELPKSLQLPDPQNARTEQFPVGESRIDVNLHLNNAEYAALVHDQLALQQLTLSNVQELQLNFQHACVAGSELTIQSERFQDRCLIAGFCAEKTAFQCLCTLAEA